MEIPAEVAAAIMGSGLLLIGAFVGWSVTLLSRVPTLKTDVDALSKGFTSHANQDLEVDKLMLERISVTEERWAARQKETIDSAQNVVNVLNSRISSLEISIVNLIEAENRRKGS